MLLTKSVKTEIGEEDGLRILATRFRGRGLPRDRYDVWMANLAPSEVLLRAFLEGGVPWSQFSRRYRAEMLARDTREDQNRTIRNHGQKFTLRLIRHLSETGNVTLLCHCAEDTAHCHRHLLKRLVESRII